MFGMFKAKGKGDSPLGNISKDIEQAKINKEKAREKAEETKLKNKSLYAEALKNGANALQEIFLNGYSQEKFNYCLDNLLAATNYNSVEPTPYYLLSLILSIAGEKEEAIKYFEVVNYIDPQFPGLEKLHAQIHGLSDPDDDSLLLVDNNQLDPDPSVEEELAEVYSLFEVGDQSAKK